MTSVARVREFDEQEALDRAMRLFWRKGYAETSLRDLVAHTGVANAGLYGAFGDKQALYRAALEHYNATYGDWLMGPLEAPDSGRAEVERFFAIVLDAVTSERFSDGCFMCNTAVEFGNEAEAVLSHARGNVARMTAAFRAALSRARKRGEVRRDLDPEAVGAFLACTFHGVAVLSRAKSDPTAIEQSVRAALSLLD